jgi:hypothetical protein
MKKLIVLVAVLCASTVYGAIGDVWNMAKDWDTNNNMSLNGPVAPSWSYRDMDGNLLVRSTAGTAISAAGTPIWAGTAAATTPPWAYAKMDFGQGDTIYFHANMIVQWVSPVAGQVNITGFQKAIYPSELVQLNHVIIARLNMMQQLRAHSAMTNFRVGQRVKFTTSDGRIIRGVLSRYNRKSVTLVTQDGAQWRVAPTLLEVDV